MTGFIVSVFPFRNRVSSTEAFEELELGKGKPSRPVLRGPGGRKAAWLLGTHKPSRLRLSYELSVTRPESGLVSGVAPLHSAVIPAKNFSCGVDQITVYHL